MPERANDFRRIVVVAAAVVVIALAATALFVALEPAEPPTETPTATAPVVAPSATPTPTPTPPAFDKTARSIDDPMSIWVVADKLRPLDPLNFEPPDLVEANVPSASALMRAEAASALEAMFAAAADGGVSGLMVQNAFRSYGTQVELYNRHVANRGQAGADLTSARPGHSEHQTGLSADIMPDTGVCAVEQCFADTPQGMWLAENAWRFGYHLRYPEGKTPVTGYEFEPWHYRYVGVELATELHESGILTLEEFFDLPPAPTYAG